MKKFIAIFVIGAITTGCGNEHAPQQQSYVQQPYAQWPTQYAQPHDTGIGTTTAVVGAGVVGAAAYMLGKSNAEKAARQTEHNVYRPTTTISQPAPARPAVQAPVAMQKPVNTQVFKPQAAKNTATVTAPRTSFSSSTMRR